MRILLIDNYDSYTYNLLALLQRLENVDVDVLKNDDPKLLIPLPYTHILISPGPDLPEAAGNLMECLRLNKHKNILGVCLGHQAIGLLFGAQLEQLEPVQHGLQANITHTQSRLFANIPLPMPIGLYHSWAISNTELPACLRITAECTKGIIMAIEHTELPIYGVQFHPESYITTNGLQIIENWLNLTC